MNTFLTALASGLGQGAVYGLIAVSFVMIYRATDVLNFAQPALVGLGVFATSYFALDLKIPFWVAVAVAMIVVAALSVGIERVAIRPMIGRPPFAAAIVTVGIFIVFLTVSNRLFGADQRTIGDPYGLKLLCLGGEVKDNFGTMACDGGVLIYEYTIVRFIVAMVAVGLLGFWLSRSKLGLGMRATAADQETAMAQGISVGRMFALAWGIGGALAALGGALLAMHGGVYQATDVMFALVALPAIIIGGLDSLKGAVIGGLVVGLSMALTRAFQFQFFPWAGVNFELVVPYILMLIVLLVRPYGLFGTKEVHRV